MPMSSATRAPSRGLLHEAAGDVGDGLRVVQAQAAAESIARDHGGNGDEQLVDFAVGEPHGDGPSFRFLGEAGGYRAKVSSAFQGAQGPKTRR